MKNLKEIKSGSKLPNPIYKQLPYVVLNNDDMVLFSGSFDELLNLDSYYDDCIVDVRLHDLYLNDNTKIN